MPKGVHLDKKLICCASCGNDFLCDGSRTKASYCSLSCYSVARKSKPLEQIECKGCLTKFTPKKRSVIYCSKGCVKRTLQLKNIENGLFFSYKKAKKHLIKSASGCSKCGWSDEIGVLELHHIDRNHKNNHISNLQILCPNCHSIDHFKSKDGQFSNNLGLINKWK